MCWIVFVLEGPCAAYLHKRILWQVLVWDGTDSVTYSEWMPSDYAFDGGQQILILPVIYS